MEDFTLAFWCESVMYIALQFMQMYKYPCITFLDSRFLGTTFILTDMLETEQNVQSLIQL